MSAARAAEIDYPHAGEVFDAGEADGVLFVTMRYVEGSDLGRAAGGGQAARARAPWPLSPRSRAARDAAHAHGACTATSSRRTC